MIPLSTPPAWLRGCVVRTDLLELYRSHCGAGRRAATLMVQEELARHLVPTIWGRVSDCADGYAFCTEWRAAAPGSDAAGRIVAAESLRHQAMHLFAPTRPSS